MPANDGLRKVAIFVSALETAAADAVLDQMGEAAAAEVRRAVMDLGDIDSGEQQQVLDEFAARQKPRPQGVEIASSLARQLADDYPETNRSPAAGRPFGFLHGAEPDRVAAILSSERPQTVALVLAHLPAGQAGDVLGRLSAALQVEVVRRLVDLEQPDADVMAEVEAALRQRLSAQTLLQRRRVAGISTISNMLENCRGAVGGRILDNLASHDRGLVERLCPAIEFDELMDFDDAALARVFDEADVELTALALLEATPEFIDRVLDGMLASEADAIRERLAHPGPVRLSDVDDARRQIAEFARRLAGQGRLRPPRSLARAA